MNPFSRPHDSPACTCLGCQDYDDALESVKAIMDGGSLDLDFILELFGLDPNDKDKFFDELKRITTTPKDGPV